MVSEKRKYFGTDGIRGKANVGKLAPDLIVKVGQAAGVLFKRGEPRYKVLIGKDTRLSGYMIEAALIAGFTSVGMDVLVTGPIPTPGMALLTRSMRADLGVMISASHNPFGDNGIKLFRPDGSKLSDEEEQSIERLMDSDLSAYLVGEYELGRTSRIDGVQDRYVEHAKKTLPRDFEFRSNLRVVIDCANGAAYKVAPLALRELGAEVVDIGVTPDGFNINRECGSTAPQILQQKVRELRADVGIALDGDADRVVMVDEQGRLIDGDQLLATIAEDWRREGKLGGSGVVGTVMSNLAFEIHLKNLGIPFKRAPVGDRYVLEMMLENKWILGGEQSGHIIMLDYATTGDGLVAAVQFVEVLQKSGKKASEVAHRFDPLPQVLKNVRFQDCKPLEDRRVKAAIASAEKRLGGEGRLVVRASGTEPVIRIMVEAREKSLAESVVDGLVAAVKKVA
jgi:phosphoglucosamine mutase